jgi:hypothetical protein
MNGHDEHDDDLAPEVEEGVEIEREAFDEDGEDDQPGEAAIRPEPPSPETDDDDSL